MHELLRFGPDAPLGDVAAATLGRRLDALGADAAALLSLLAVAGADVPAAVLAAGARRTVPDVTDALRRATGADVLRETDGRRAFRHDLLAEVAAARLRGADLLDAHRRLADAWSAIDTPPGRQARARHLLAAVPAVDPATALDATVAAGDELVAARSPTAAIVLLQRAAEVAADHVPGAVALRGRVLVALSDARWAAGAMYPSMVTAAAASDLLVDTTTRRCAPAPRSVLPAATTTSRSTRSAGDGSPTCWPRCPADDSPLRAELLGRAAVLATAVPTEIPAGHRLADDAVTMARRLGDPNALVQALSDRYFCVVSVRDDDARAAAADEVIDLARRTGRRISWSLSGCRRSSRRRHVPDRRRWLGVRRA